MDRSAMKGKLGIVAAVEEETMVIETVRENSAAAEAGLKSGDVLVQVNGRDITSMKELRYSLAGGLRGEIATLIVSRDGIVKTLNATLK
ncbi:MAG: PDZ domain-containing protein [Planctomycetes bacterium]|nr:PDZ domain-containing protein [Planctomycetota bacterium]